MHYIQMFLLLIFLGSSADYSGAVDPNGGVQADAGCGIDPNGCPDTNGGGAMDPNGAGG